MPVDRFTGTLPVDNGGTGGTSAAAALAALGIQMGNAALVSGVTAAIAATISATSRIVGFVKTSAPGAGSLTVQYAALPGNRVVGEPGSFKLTALIAAGTINVLDTSNLDWFVLG